MRFAIPDQLFQLLHTRHTSTRIHIVNRKRNIDRQYIPPDRAALSSPQLYSLDYTAYGANDRIGRLEWEFYSELSAIKACLLQARNLKSLRLRVSSDNIPRQSVWTTGPQCLTFDSDDNFVPLLELRFEFETYDMSEKYCQQWANAMDWTQLRRLDLDGGSPPHLLAALTGRVPQLKVLSFGFRQPTYTWGYPNADVFQAFSDSIGGLEDVVASNACAQPFDEIRDAFLLKHGHSLKKLSVSYGATGQGWEEADVQGLAERGPGICDLALKIATTEDYSAGWVSSFTLYCVVLMLIFANPGIARGHNASIQSLQTPPHPRTDNAPRHTSSASSSEYRFTQHTIRRWRVTSLLPERRNLPRACH
jgi:hypothetical protein